MSRKKLDHITAGKLIAEYYNGGSVNAACNKLNICRKTFYNLMNKYNLKFSTPKIVDK